MNVSFWAILKCSSIGVMRPLLGHAPGFSVSLSHYAFHTYCVLTSCVIVVQNIVQMKLDGEELAWDMNYTKLGRSPDKLQTMRKSKAFYLHIIAA